MESRIAIFRKLVRDCMRDVPLAVAQGTPLGDAVRRRLGPHEGIANVRLWLGADVRRGCDLRLIST